MVSFNPRAKMQSQYEKDAAAKKAAEARSKAVSGVTTVGKGGVTFATIDKWLADNPDAEYFRIADSTKKVGTGYMRRDSAGMSSDQAAAIVGQDRDKGNSVIRRYATVQAAGATAKGKRGEQATVGINYTPTDFYKANGFEYSAADGFILSRNEYNKLKESAAKKGKADQFLSAGAEKKPTFTSDYGKDKGAILTGEGVDTNRRAGLGEDGEDALANEEDIAAATKRKLLG